MILYGGGGQEERRGGSETQGQVTLKKGPWTAAEDEVLAAYVREHGEGNWNAVQRNTGLARCGKSCRLRWANHLRPNLKKGAFSPEEERLIIQLHAQLGNKWARMAAQLPGRTDNEIKNYWNTRVKRLQRQGLPLYPPDIVPVHQNQAHQNQKQQSLYMRPPSSQPATPCSPLSSSTHTTPSMLGGPSSSSSFTFHTRPQFHPHSPTPCPSPTTPHPPSPLSPTPPPPPHPLSPRLSSPHQPHTLPLFSAPRSPTLTPAATTRDATFTFPKPPPLLKAPMRFRRFGFDQRDNDNGNNSCKASNNVVPTSAGGGCFFLPFQPPIKDSSLYSSIITHPYSSPATPTGATSFNLNASSISPSSHMQPLSSNPAFSPTSSTNLVQTQFGSLSVQSTSSFYPAKQELPSNQNLIFTGIGTFNATHKTEEHENQNKRDCAARASGSGLLEDVLEEAETFADGRGPKRRQVSGDFGYLDSSGIISLPSGPKPNQDELLQVSGTQEDLAKLLDSIPSNVRVPEWRSDSADISNGQSSVVTDDNLTLDAQQIASLFPPDPAADEPGNYNPACSWDNLHGIC